MMRALGLQLIEEDRKRCRETLRTFNLADNVSRQRAKAELASDFTRLSPEDQALFPGLATGFAAGISCPKTKKGFEEMMRAAQQGNPAAKAPSIKEMKATIRKAGFGVADLVEKSDVVKRYHEALARLGK